VSDTALLVADYDRTTRELVKVVARQAGWAGDILEAASGAGAFSLATEAPVVTAVLDAQMPILDGVKAAEAIWNYCPGLPVIFYTSEPLHGPVLERAQAIQKGKLDELTRALTALISGNPARPPCDAPDAIVLQALLAARDNSPLMILSPSGEFKFANAAACQLYELPYPARGSHFDELNALYASGKSREVRSLPFAQAIETGHPVEDEVRLQKGDGTVVTARVTAVPHRAVTGELTSVSLYTRPETIITR
jgi:CheY-like chemotaxis protein